MLQSRKIDEVEERLSLAIATIVERHRTAGETLTWRLVHEIEDEAFQTIEKAGDLDLRYVEMMRSSPLCGFRRSDQPADFKKHGALPVAFSIIGDTYYKLH